tara:strand:+ start:10451 stop:10675 length:225 start_codon:yes stop_codon:yes gene_type:complete
MCDEEPKWTIEKHRADKQFSRDEDARRLESGEVTREELAKENGLFSSPIIGKIRIVRHPPRAVQRKSTDKKNRG